MSELALDLFNAISEIVKLRNRIAELETEVEELIDLGNKLSYVVYETQHEKLAKKWTMLVSKK